MLDKNKLRSEIKETALELRGMKAKRGRFVSVDDYWDWKKAHEFAQTKMRATMLCALTADRRNKKHLPEKAFPYGPWKTEAEFLKAVREHGDEHFSIREAA